MTLAQVSGFLDAVSAAERIELRQGMHVARVAQATQKDYKRAWNDLKPPNGARQ